MLENGLAFFRSPEVEDVNIYNVSAISLIRRAESAKRHLFLRWPVRVCLSIKDLLDEGESDVLDSCFGKKLPGGWLVLQLAVDDELCSEAATRASLRC